MTFDWIWPSIKAILWWKMTFDGRQPLMKDDVYDGNDVLLKITFDGLQPLMEASHWWKTTFDGR